MLWKDSAIKTLRLKLSIKTAHKIIFSENHSITLQAHCSVIIFKERNDKMVNDIKCQMFVEGDPKKLKKFFNLVKCEECGRVFDFEAIIPYPDDIYLGPLTAEAIKKCGKNNWYDFNKEYWGTYYNAYETERTGNMIEFLVGWRIPMRLFMDMALKFPDIKFTINYASRQDGGPCGSVTLFMQKGEEIDERASLSPGTDEYNKAREDMFRWE